MHLLLSLPANRNLADVVRQLKTNSALILRERCRRFHWQDGYGANSVSPSQVATVRAYIEGQQRHHATRTYEQEVIALLDKSGVQYEREYLF